jgi:hypothetical protein
MRVRSLNSSDEHARAEAVRRLCPCRTHADWTLDRYVVPKRHDASPVVRQAVNFVMNEEFEHDMVKQPRAAQSPARPDAVTAVLDDGASPKRCRCRPGLSSLAYNEQALRAKTAGRD